MIEIRLMKVLLLLTFISFGAFANEACSRIAIINQQEVLVDPSTDRKGEGLRFHLEKDELAKKYLDEYQNVVQNNLRPAIIGTIGTGLVLSAFISNSSNDNRKALIIAGASTILINFLLDKTIEADNEKNLTRAIEEYNKRQNPKIFLKDQSSSNNGIMLEKSWQF